MNDWRAIPVEDTALPTRAKNSLRNGGFYSLGDVAAARDIELYRCPELGRGTLKEIRDYIQRETGAITGMYRLQLERQLDAMRERKAILDRDIASLEKRLAK